MFFKAFWQDYLFKKKLFRDGKPLENSVDFRF